MSDTPAGRLAKLRAANPTWRISGDSSGDRFVATNRGDGRRLVADTIEELADLLAGESW